MIISTSDLFIHFVSRSYVGKAHDYNILKTIFAPTKSWFKSLVVRVDLGYQGFAKDYVCKKIIIPHKKPRNNELTQDKKDENTSFSRERVAVEHSIGGMKRYRILSERLRMHDFGLYDTVLGVCAGLWNFQLLPK